MKYFFFHPDKNPAVVDVTSAMPPPGAEELTGKNEKDIFLCHCYEASY